jgi:NarL family two-component system response regulator LiaR
MSKKVLIADDSATVRWYIRGVLRERADLEVEEASSGLEAVEKAKAFRPDLILLDLAMPELNGAEAASILKKSLPGVPIILFTVYADGIGPSLASAVGVDLVLSKPEGISQLLDVIGPMLGEPPKSSSASAS